MEIPPFRPFSKSTSKCERYETRFIIEKQFLKRSWSEVDFLTIGTEFNIRYGWVVVIYQGFQALPRGRVPNTTEAVIRWGYCKQRNKIILSWFSNRWRYLMIFSLISIRILAWCQACHEINHLNICSMNLRLLIGSEFDTMHETIFEQIKCTKIMLNVKIMHVTSLVKMQHF